MTKVGVIGAAGNMGSLACGWVQEADGLELVAQITEDNSIEDLADAEVAIDFTHPGVVMDHVAWCIDHGVHLVVGTSGFTDERLATIEKKLGSDPAVGVLVVPNFSIGAVLMMRFAAEAAWFFESVEVVELHHPTKLDAPSGTSIRTAHLVAAARASAGLDAMPDATADDPVGARGGTVAGVRVHSVRARGLVAHQEVILGNGGETLTIRHDMPDRVAAMPGVVASIRYVVDNPGLTVGLESVLGLGPA
ncbi:MAG: 4-hydroxy-tetrahydrodipicolinate reductase [Actinomycetota bacterium]|nr:4-hydroxy-tetrahydrodipicolinate reductase [Actinomycetota bacterium]